MDGRGGRDGREGGGVVVTTSIPPSQFQGGGGWVGGIGRGRRGVAVGFCI